MAEAVATPSLAPEDAVVSYFEVHVRRGDRWVIDCTAPSAAEAVAEAEDIARRLDVLGVRVVNERYNRHTDQSAARVILKLEKPERKRPAGPVRLVAPPRTALRQAAPGAPPAAAPVPDPTPLLPPDEPFEPASPISPWQLFAWASLALAGAATLLFVLLLLVA